MIELGIDLFGNMRLDPKNGSRQTVEARLKEIVEQAKLMDELGLDFIALGEHHRKEYAVTAPEIVLAAVSTVTKNIKLSSAVSVISSTDPVKLYQDFATVDLLSGGRAEIMAGRGSFIESFPLFGYPLTDYEDLFEENLDLLLTLNENEVVNWSGKFRPELKNQALYPQPKNGKLPIWIAVGGTPASVIRAAKLGLPVMFAIIGGTVDRFIPLVEYYKQAWEAAGHSMEDYQVGVHLHSYFVEDGVDMVKTHFPAFAAGKNKIGKERNWPHFDREQYDISRGPLGHLIAGEANYAIEKILQTIEVLGLTRFSAHMDVPSATHAEVMKSIEIYGNIIAPKVREALKG